MADKQGTQWYNLDSLELWAENPNNGDQGAIITSVNKFGYNDVVVVYHGVVMGGNHRIIALRQLKQGGYVLSAKDTQARENGTGWQITGMDVSHLETQQEANAFALALNRTARLGHDDPAMLAALLQDVAAQSDELLSSTGFDHEDLDDLLRELNPIRPPEDPGAQIDKAAKLQEKWQVERGDVFVIPSVTGDGSHKILCGDSTDSDDVARLMDGVKADLVLTDPPYGEIQSAWDVQVIWWPMFDGILKGNGWLAFTTSMKYWLSIASELDECGWLFRWDGVWNKSNGFLHSKHLPMRAHENIAVYTKKNAKVSEFFFDGYGAGEEGEPWTYTTQKNSRKGGGTYNEIPNMNASGRADGRRWLITSWYASKGDICTWSGMNATAKPVRIFEKLVLALCPRNEIVYDPFFGSGTTIVAAEITQRIGYGIELMPEYVAVCLERLSDMGLQPQLENQPERVKQNNYDS